MRLIGGECLVILMSIVGLGVFVLASVGIGLRLVSLSRRGHRLASLSLGLAFLLNPGLGAPLLTVAFTWAAGLGAALPYVQGTGLACANLGALALWVFTWRTFRLADRWAVALVVGATVVMAGSIVGQVLGPGLAAPFHSGIWFWVGLPARALSLLWAAVESLRYYRLMRRRLRLGLAEPLLVNRFLLWGIGALAASATIASSAATVALGPGADPAAIALLRLGGSACGLGAAGAIWLAFFPPVAYRRRFAVEGAVTAEPA